ncbi:hypothetical protein [Rhodopirellula baltica]|uniref:UbiA prenyltransferase n=1 Tax=Rhodopirellula baltica WH47 TaxID=991778 RepID=F2ALX0_RHOBT|nr:hypothetical protein [Rhodopirellula baltica]EGF29342.1 conserved hypothetical protein, membrane [Rhodopirellula baltica WH47]
MRPPESNSQVESAPTPVRQSETPVERLPLACWLNVLSLDAVLVALLWQFVFVLSFCGRAPRWYESFVLASVVWLIYVADRLLDGARLDLSKPHLVRHRMHHQFSPVWVTAWIVVLLIASSVVVLWMDAAVIRIGLLIAALVLAYGAGVHFWPGRATVRHVFAKEVQVGAIFAAGVSLIAWSEAPSVSLGLACVASATLFTVNCWAVAERESVADQNYDASRAGKPRRELVAIWSVAVVAGITGMTGWLPGLVVVCLVGGSMALFATTCCWRWKGRALSEWSRLASSADVRLPCFDRWVPMADWSLMLSPMICWAVV